MKLCKSKLNEGNLIIEECVEKEKKAQHAFIKESNECMLKAAKDEKRLENLMGFKKRAYNGKKERERKSPEWRIHQTNNRDSD